MAEEDNQDQYSRSPVPYNPRTAAAQKFQEHEAQLPLQNALELARLQKSQAELEFQGRAQLDAERTQANTLRQGAAFYAAKPVLEKYLRDNNLPVGSPGHAEAYANFAAQFPYALRYLPDVAKTVQEHAEVHDLKSKLDQSLQALRGAQLGPGESGTVNAAGEPSVSSRAPVDQQVVARYSKVQGELSGAKALQTSEIARQAKANAGTPNVPYNPADPLAVPIEARITAAETESNLLRQHLPALTSAAQPAAASQQTAAPIPTAAPVATPDATPIPENSQGVPQPQPAAAPTHLGRYNPDTGNFE